MLRPGAASRSPNENASSSKLLCRQADHTSERVIAACTSLSLSPSCKQCESNDCVSAWHPLALTHSTCALLVEACCLSAAHVHLPDLSAAAAQTCSQSSAVAIGSAGLLCDLGALTWLCCMEDPPGHSPVAL